MGRLYIDKYTGTIEKTDVYLVKLTMKDGTVYENLEPKRLFPITCPNMYITLLDQDEKEIGFVREYQELDEQSQNALQNCFREYYLIPKISKVTDVEDKFGSLTWFVKTDRGDISFRIRNRHSDIKMLYGTRRVIIRDSNDNRYEIENFDALDKKSQILLFSYV